MQRIQRRLNDSEKSGKQEKSLSKKFSDFSQTEAPVYGGMVASYKKGRKQATYYVAQHEIHEYFVLETFNRIGFNTPKARIIDSYPGAEHTPYIASKGIQGYIPMCVFLPLTNPDYKLLISQDPKLTALHERYQLDIKRQVVLDKKTGRVCKISGNLFAAHIGAVLVHDADLKPEGLNVGLVKVGDRFFAHFIDKDRARLEGETFQSNMENPYVRFGLGLVYVRRSILFENTGTEQIYHVISEIEHALTSGDFERIFKNDRIVASDHFSESTFLVKVMTPQFMFRMVREKYTKEKIDQLCANLQKTAGSAVEFYREKDPTFLEDFRKREQIRSEIADKALEQISCSCQEKQALKLIVMEDLRAPYYQHLFVNRKFIQEVDKENQLLLDEIFQDVRNEVEQLKVEEVEEEKEVFIPITDLVQAEEKLAEFSEPMEAKVEKDKKTPLDIEPRRPASAWEWCRFLSCCCAKKEHTADTLPYTRKYSV